MKSKTIAAFLLAALTVCAPALADTENKEPSADSTTAETKPSPAADNEGGSSQEVEKKASGTTDKKKAPEKKDVEKKDEKKAPEKKDVEKKDEKKAQKKEAEKKPKGAEGTPALVAPSFYDVWLKGRLSVGPMYSKADVQDTHVPFREDQEGHFIGNINDLQDQGASGFGLAIRYNLRSWLAVELAGFDRAELRACNKDGKNYDGTLELQSWRAQGLVQWPFETVPLTVFAGVGAAKVDAKFKHNPWWRYGWSVPDDYDRYGQGSTEGRNGVSRRMVLEKPSTALVATVGATLRLHDHLHLDVFWEKVDSDDIAVDFYRTAGHDTIHMLSGHFPTGYTAVGASLRYVF